MKIRRTILLKEVESVAAGLSEKALVEQADCFAFKNGYVYTYNDDVACRRKSSFSFEMAVPAKPLMELLRKKKNPWLTVEENEKGLKIFDSNFEGCIYADKKIIQPRVKRPKCWKKLPIYLIEAMQFVSYCTGKDTPLDCVHIHPDFIEATDNFHASRYKIQTFFERSLLIEKKNITPIIAINPIKYAIKNKWIHFKNNENFIISCRYSRKEYPDLDFLFDNQTGNTIEWPKKILTELQNFIVNGVNPLLEIKLCNNKLSIFSQCTKYEERKNNDIFIVSNTLSLNTKYEGKPLVFKVNYKTLNDMIVKYGHRCTVDIDNKRIIAGNEKLMYVTSIEAVE